MGDRHYPPLREYDIASENGKINRLATDFFTARETWYLLLGMHSYNGNQRSLDLRSHHP